MTTIKVRGMSCQHCVNAVTKALRAIEGIQDVQVDLDQGTASFTQAGPVDLPVDLEVVKQAIIKAGYEVEED
jgi:copper chaperone